MCDRWQLLFDTLNKPQDNLPLVILRVAFGILMFWSTTRFIANGWVQEFYVEPIYHFTYLGFGWIQPLDAIGMMMIFIALLVLSACISLGLFYRFSIIAFFLLFTYVEFIDKTYYLNHYYFISVMSLLMIVLPLNNRFSLDNIIFKRSTQFYAPIWAIYAPRLMVGIVYFYAGFAKLTGDWLLEALPLHIWLPANSDMPLIGQFFDELWVAYAMSWGGALYDLTIPFWLSWRRSRLIAYFFVIFFHVMTALLFNIGVFPWVMITLTLIFFDAKDWYQIGKRFHFNIPKPHYENKVHTSSLILGLVFVFFLWQLLMPLRHYLYEGNHHWTNEGYRFAWHVMLVEKNGTVSYRIENPDTDQFWIVYPSDYLTPQQAQQMSFQPDMILQFAHFLGDTYAEQCDCIPEVYADTYVSLNLRRGQSIVNANYDLNNINESLFSSDWIIPLKSD